jgi:hypothetical protein
MKKRVVDLTAKELETVARDAWTAAARDALSRGLSITGRRDGKRVRVHPDGRVEELDPARSKKSRPVKKSKSSAA